MAAIGLIGAGQVIVVFDREVVTSYGASAVLTVGGLPLVWAGEPARAFLDANVDLGVVVGDPWVCVADEDPLVVVPPGGGSYLGRRSGRVVTAV